MQIEILTIFPDYFRSPLGESLLGKAIASDRIRVTVTDLRTFAEGRHRKVDDEPYGGGAGMVMMVPVLAAAIEARRQPDGLPPAWTVLLTPDGRPLDQRLVEDLASRDRILLVCGRYEGIDERARALGLFDAEISLGDFVLPGGEAAALAVTEAVSRLVPGVVGCAESLEQESFAQERLDYPHYTRPREFRGATVPEPLLSGDHARILRWRRSRALARTRERRPDLLDRRPEEPGEGDE
ncbi:MAG: tRNA (guanosine(37)-N1)-methyltransferase TrmD [Acidobacteriota bacterium]